jgi:hypothetical protein
MENLVLREMVDLHFQMVHTSQKWDKMADDLQKITKLKVPYNGKMCKDKWNGLNSNYKKVVDYHVGTSHHIPFWDLTIEKCSCLFFQGNLMESFMTLFKHSKERSCLMHQDT